jgi:hypothetical protein
LSTHIRKNKRTLVQRLRDECEPVLLVGGISEALDGRLLDARLGEGDDRVGDLHLHPRVHAAEIVHHRVQRQLPNADENVLAALLHPCPRERVALLHRPQPCEDFRKLGRVEGLHREVDASNRVEAKRAENGDIGRLGARGCECGRFGDNAVDAFNQNPVPGGRKIHLQPVPRLADGESRHGGDRHVLRILGGVGFSQNLHGLP